MWAWGSSSPKLNRFGKLTQEVSVGSFRANGLGNGGHCSTLERLYAWEKKLYQEVKVCNSFFLLVPHAFSRSKQSWPLI
jgi:hypothetical protein